MRWVRTQSIQAASPLAAVLRRRGGVRASYFETARRTLRAAEKTSGSEPGRRPPERVGRPLPPPDRVSPPRCDDSTLPAWALATGRVNCSGAGRAPRSGGPRGAPRPRGSLASPARTPVALDPGCGGPRAARRPTPRRRNSPPFHGNGLGLNENPRLIGCRHVPVDRSRTVSAKEEGSPSGSRWVKTTS
jgi:hypothetical protein